MYSWHLGDDLVHCHVVSKIEEASFTGSIRYTNAKGELLAVLEDVEAQVFEKAEESDDTQTADVVADVDERHYRVESFAEVQAFAERLKMTEAMGLQNPFFSVHEGTARDVSVVPVMR